jgi:phosphate transport system substrate-binding protein
MRRFVLLAIGLPLGVLVLAAAGCGSNDEGGGDGDGLGGSIEADGSSTVGPYVTRAAEEFRAEEPDVKVTVGISGTGGGFERFCRGETDLSDASREIGDDEAAECAENGVEFTRFEVANDAITVIVNPDNDWATCLTTKQLKAIWEPGSKIDNWNEVSPDYPDVPLRLYGPGTDSGTFDYFTGEINGEEGASRSDFSASEDDNVILQGVSGEDGGMGYLGFSYYGENQGRVAAVEVDAGDGCVAPLLESAQDGTYTPLSRPLFVYAKNTSLEESQVEAFMRFMIDNQESIAASAGYVPLNDQQVAADVEALDTASS